MQPLLKLTRNVSSPSPVSAPDPAPGSGLDPVSVRLAGLERESSIACSALLLAVGLTGVVLFHWVRGGREGPDVGGVAADGWLIPFDIWRLHTLSDHFEQCSDSFVEAAGSMKGDRLEHRQRWRVREVLSGTLEDFHRASKLAQIPQRGSVLHLASAQQIT